MSRLKEHAAMVKHADIIAIIVDQWEECALLTPTELAYFEQLLDEGDTPGDVSRAMQRRAQQIEWAAE